VLTGGRRCPSRHGVGGWRRHLPWYEVDAFCHRTSPWQWIRGEAALLSYDEHAIPRWTHKFHIKKGYVTTRNKYMRCEKLFYTFDVLNGRYLSVRATPGDWGLNDLAVPLLRQSLACGRPDYVHALFDAGAGPSDAAVRTLWDLVEQEHPRLDVTLRACRHPHRVRLWKALPVEQFTVHQEPGPYVGAPPKEIRLAETTTVLKGEAAEQAVRTVICREVVRGPRRIAGTRCSRPAWWSPTRSWGSSGCGSVVSRATGWGCMTSPWTRCRAVTTRRARTRDGPAGSGGRCR
jgi:hypothetical protein